jgi:hypothetical protein
MVEQTDNGTGSSLDTLANNRSGRATGLTTLTPLPRRWSPVLKVLLRIKSWLGPDKTLRRLSFIHVAYWVLVDHFPDEDRRSKYSYLMFISNFNGSWFDYIDVFSTAVPQKMAMLWGSSFGFPGARPPRQFTNYIRGVDWPLAHYYSAYPGATSTEIASAQRIHESFEAQLANPAELDDRHLARTWRGFVADVQRDL